MRVYANGKNISTHSLCNVLVQGERYAETIVFVLERIYEGIDLLDCDFSIRGVNAEGGECMQILSPISDKGNVLLYWSVSEYFTAVAGKLDLELRASFTSENGESCVLKYQMSPITVYPSPEGSDIVVPDTSEQIISEINAVVSNGVKQIQQTIDSFDTETIEERLDNMDSNIEVFLARPEVIPVTREQYDSMEHKKNALYVIVKEAVI